MSFLLQKFFVRPPVLIDLKPGPAGEEWVAYLYKKNGHEIIARNYEVISTKKLGEIDIVTRKQKRIHIIEVKTRASERFMPIEETVNYHKQILLRRMAKLFLQNNSKFQNYDIQIDLAFVLLDPVDNSVKSVKIIENAIEDS